MGTGAKMRRSSLLWVALVVVGCQAQAPTEACEESGLMETIPLGKDCDMEQISATKMKVTFPMKEHKVFFPCLFSRTPVVTVQIRGDSDKIFGVSIKDLQNGYFTVNVQRVDDTEDSDMTCADYELQYLA